MVEKLNVFELDDGDESAEHKKLGSFKSIESKSDDYLAFQSKLDKYKITSTINWLSSRKRYSLTVVMVLPYSKYRLVDHRIMVAVIVTSTAKGIFFAVLERGS